MSNSFDYTAFGYTSPTPNAQDFTAMLTTEVGLSSASITSAQAQITASLAWSVNWVLCDLATLNNAMYLRAVYCLATDRLILTGQDPTDGSSTQFQTLRSNLKVNEFIPGVLSSSGDEGTHQSFKVAESLQNLTLPDLQNLKTPWGREYVGYAQQLSPIWGVS